MVYEHAMCFMKCHTFVLGVSNAGLHSSCCGSRMNSKLAFLPRICSCGMRISQGNNDAMLIIWCIFVYFIDHCSSAWRAVIKVMLSLQDGVVVCTLARGKHVILNMAGEILNVIEVLSRRPRWARDDSLGKTRRFRACATVSSPLLTQRAIEERYYQFIS